MKYLLLLLTLVNATNAWAGYSPATIVTDPSGINQMAVKPANTAPAATDPAGVVSISPNGNSMSIGSSVLPTGASTSALQTTGNTSLASILTALGSPFQAGGSIGNTSFGISGTLPAFTATPTFNLGTLNGAATSALQTTGNTSLASVVTNTANIPAKGQATMANSTPVTIASDQVAPKTYGNANAAFSQTSVTTTASTVSAPANAVRVLIQGDSSNTDCIRYRFDGTAATSAVGIVAQPGQDSGQLDSGMSVSVAACSGTQKVNVQYFAQ